MTIGGAKSSDQPVDLRDQPGDALQATEKAERTAASEQKAKAPVEADVKILETNELDEFQLLEKKAQDAGKNQQETAEEKAERELRESLEAEKKMAAQKVIDEEKARREAAQAYQKRVQDDQDAYNEYKDDVNEEVNRYTLPDQDDLNWNGLTP
jgi:hypothetical protein